MRQVIARDLTPLHAGIQHVIDAHNLAEHVWH
jgi:hypothetical protein